jgi:polyisoprenoid-binding protein YceI
MKPLLKFALIIVTLVGLFSFSLLKNNWNIDPDYSIKFSTKRAEGTFSGLQGTIMFDPNDLAHSMMDVTVDARTIKTGNDTKDAHARSESWLDTGKYPNIRFKSSVFFRSSDMIVANGSVELHGVQRPVQIFFHFPEDSGRAIFAGYCLVNWRNFGIKGNAMGIMVGDEVEISLNVPVWKSYN